MLPETEGRRAVVLNFIFNNQSGIIALARIHRPSKTFSEDFFEYPLEFPQIMEYIDRYMTEYDVYFCPHLFAEKKRVKEAVIKTPVIWADLDDCPPNKLLIEPNITVETSPGRYQGYWAIPDADPSDAEEISKRIAYHHHADGADISGWDLTQLLRVPFTFNHKRSQINPDYINVYKTNGAHYTLNDFQGKYLKTEATTTVNIIPLPEVVEDAQEVLERHRTKLPMSFWGLYQETPEEDWSKALWRLEMACFEVGMTLEETLSVAMNAACNKYVRDLRPNGLLWKEINRAYKNWAERHQIITKDTTLETELLTDEERASARADITFIEDYIEWAKTLGDAAWQYHQAGAFVVLSSVLAGPVRLPTSFGTMTPNLWFMILADTTLTRKTTAMDIAMDLVTDVDSDAILATDGSIEGLFTSLAMRPGRPSVFLRDEFSGLIEAMAHKDYMSGMSETLTKLYDGKFQKRVLRKETIEVRDPCLIIFGGGIRSRLLQLFTHEHVSSGFLPRFLFITAESDVSKLRPLGPPTVTSTTQRDVLADRLFEMKQWYGRAGSMSVTKPQGGPLKIETQGHFNATLSSAAWMRYNKIEATMLEAGIGSVRQDLITPTFDRLAKSGLKAAVLIAASRDLCEQIVVQERDIIKAFSYIEEWRHYTIEVINNIGRTTQEHVMAQIMALVTKKPGVQRSEVMQRHHLTAREASQYFETLDQRGILIRQTHGRGERLYPAGV